MSRDQSARERARGLLEKRQKAEKRRQNAENFYKMINVLFFTKDPETPQINVTEQEGHYIFQDYQAARNFYLKINIAIGKDFEEQEKEEIAAKNFNQKVFWYSSENIFSHWKSNLPRLEGEKLIFNYAGIESANNHYFCHIGESEGCLVRKDLFLLLINDFKKEVASYSAVLKKDQAARAVEILNLKKEREIYSDIMENLSREVSPQYCSDVVSKLFPKDDEKLKAIEEKSLDEQKQILLELMGQLFLSALRRADSATNDMEIIKERMDLIRKINDFQNLAFVYKELFSHKIENSAIHSTLLDFGFDFRQDEREVMEMMKIDFNPSEIEALKKKIGKVGLFKSGFDIKTGVEPQLADKSEKEEIEKIFDTDSSQSTTDEDDLSFESEIEDEEQAAKSGFIMETNIEDKAASQISPTNVPSDFVNMGLASTYDEPSASQPEKQIEKQELISQDLPKPSPLELENADLRKKLLKSFNSLEKLRTKFDTLSTELHRTKNSASKAEKSLQKEIKNLKKSITALAAGNEESKAFLNGAEIQNTRLKEEFEAAKRELHQLRSEKEQRKNLQEENLALKQELEKSKGENEKLKQSFQAEREQKKKLEEHLLPIRKELDEIRKLMEESDLQKKALTKEVSELEKKLEEQKLKAQGIFSAALDTFNKSTHAESFEKGMKEGWMRAFASMGYGVPADFQGSAMPPASSVYPAAAIPVSSITHSKDETRKR